MVSVWWSFLFAFFLLVGDLEYFGVVQKWQQTMAWYKENVLSHKLKSTTLHARSFKVSICGLWQSFTIVSVQIAQKTAKCNSKLHFITVRREEHMDLKLTVARMSSQIMVCCDIFAESPAALNFVLAAWKCTRANFVLTTKFLRPFFCKTACEKCLSDSVFSISWKALHPNSKTHVHPSIP